MTEGRLTYITVNKILRSWSILMTNMALWPRKRRGVQVRCRKTRWWAGFMCNHAFQRCYETINDVYRWECSWMKWFFHLNVLVLLTQFSLSSCHHWWDLNQFVLSPVSSVTPVSQRSISSFLPGSRQSSDPDPALFGGTQELALTSACFAAPNHTWLKLDCVTGWRSINSSRRHCRFVPQEYYCKTLSQSYKDRWEVVKIE